MKKSILVASLLTALSVPAFAQVPATGSFPRDSSQIRDDNHELRPDRVDERSPDVGLNANDAKDARQKRLKEYREGKEGKGDGRDDADWSRPAAPKPKPTTPGY